MRPKVLTQHASHWQNGAIYILILLIPFIHAPGAAAQSKFARETYPQGDYAPPLDTPLCLSGNFGEVRNRHFHAGTDLRTNSEEGNIYRDIRRTITRFVGTVTIALVLEGLIMIIKYSQLDMAGNLIYPIFVIIAAAVLLVGLGAFLHLSKTSSHEHNKGN